MEQAAAKLWNRHFTMLTIGQIVSLFGNAVLRFALPMHIYLISGSAELMGRVLALSMIPMAILSPVGGALADRISKKRIIVFLDFFTAAVTFVYLWTTGFLSIIPITIIALMLFSSIKTMMSSATDASVPLIVPPDQLVRANSVTMTINTLSLLLGPALGGVLLFGFGLEPILLISGICFVLAAVMEIFIRIPNVKQKSSGNMAADIMGDTVDGIRFAVKEKPIIGKILLIVFVFSFVAPGLGAIGVPVMIIQNLGMDERMVGISQGILGAGGVVGGILVGVLGQKLRIQKNHWPLLIIGILVIPIGLASFLSAHGVLAFSIITASMFVMMGMSTLFTIQIMTYIQQATPAELLGKMMALVMLAALAAQPLGSWLVGVLFERFGEDPSIIFFSAALLIILIALWSKMYFKSIPSDVKLSVSGNTP